MEIRERILRKTLPVVINSFNQLTYLRNSVENFVRNEFKNIIILDNGSSYEPLIEFYNNLPDLFTEAVKPLVIYYNANMGPRYFHQSRLFSQLLPCAHIYTDPDLHFDDLAPNFCSYLLDLSHKYKLFKVGSALTLPTEDEIKPGLFMKPGETTQQIPMLEWESQFWQSELEPRIYNAPIDTTLHLFNPDYFEASPYFLVGLRVALPGFEVKHLPWYKNDAVHLEEDLYYKQIALLYNNY
jgi:hypothetical protein